MTLHKEKVSSLEKSNSKSSITGYQPQIISLCSGKGGVGKSFIASSLAITMAKSGVNVVLIDFDLNGANLHSWLGQSPTCPNLSLYFKNKNLQLKELLKNTVLDKLKVVHGFWPTWALEPVANETLFKLIHEIKSLNTDIVIVDLGTGFNSFSWELLKNSDQKILVTTSEPISIEKTYRWIEKYIVSALKDKNPTSFSEEKVWEKWFGRKEKISNLFELREFLEKEINCSQSATIEDVVHQFLGPIQLIFNQTRNFEDESMGNSVKSVVNKSYFTQLDYLGYIQFDNSVWQSSRQKDPVLITQPYSPQVGQFLNLSKQIMLCKNNKFVAAS